MNISAAQQAERIEAELRRARRPEVTAEHHARFARTVAAAMPREGRADSDKSPRTANVFRPEVG